MKVVESNVPGIRKTKQFQTGYIYFIGWGVEFVN